MQAYLGCTPPDDAQGCLQDVHWSSGAFGYFPTYYPNFTTALQFDSCVVSRYTLGAMCAVQLYNAARIDLPTLDEDISNGRFDGLLSWLRCKVHVIGSLHATADEVMLAATGKAIDPQEFTRQAYTVVEHIKNHAPRVPLHASCITRCNRYIEEKYSAIYGL